MTASDLTALWRKSSRSTDTGGACVEVAALWRKSIRSGDTGGQCVEVAVTSPAITVSEAAL
ncbi:DUF397 domain-containing protein [Actinoallomurus sp. NPDC052308]|uniref:DUF397 domain-containing protein n=1 Tax=Actinoallomurus sp. NPDC052308 TaxID=3155530 RepID=UPI003448410A